MTDKNLVVVSDSTASSTAGSDDAYGTIDLNAISRATNLANDAFLTVEQVKDVPDDMVSLREAVNNLSDAVTALAGELYQLGVAVRSGKISVIDIES